MALLLQWLKLRQGNRNYIEVEKNEIQNKRRVRIVLIATCIRVAHRPSLYNRVCLPSLRCSDSHLWLDGGWDLEIWLEAVRFQPWSIWLHNNEYIYVLRGSEWKWTERITFAFDRSDNRFPTASCSQGRGLDRRSIYDHRHSNGRATLWNARHGCMHGWAWTDRHCQINWAWPTATINLSVEIRIIAKQSGLRELHHGQHVKTLFRCDKSSLTQSRNLGIPKQCSISLAVFHNIETLTSDNPLKIWWQKLPYLDRR